MKLRNGVYLNLGPDICHEVPEGSMEKLQRGTECSRLWQPLHPAHKATKRRLCPDPAVGSGHKETRTQVSIPLTTTCPRTVTRVLPQRSGSS